MTYSERNGLRAVIAIVALGWIGQIIGAIVHGGVGGTGYTWFARACWLGVTAFVVHRYITASREGFRED